MIPKNPKNKNPLTKIEAITLTIIATIPNTNPCFAWYIASLLSFFAKSTIIKPIIGMNAPRNANTLSSSFFDIF